MDQNCLIQNATERFLLEFKILLINFLIKCFTVILFDMSARYFFLTLPYYNRSSSDEILHNYLLSTYI